MTRSCPLRRSFGSSRLTVSSTRLPRKPKRSSKAPDLAPGEKPPSTVLGNTRTREGSTPASDKNRRRVYRLTEVISLARSADQRSARLMPSHASQPCSCSQSGTPRLEASPAASGERCKWPQNTKSNGPRVAAARSAASEYDSRLPRALSCRTPRGSAAPLPSPSRGSTTIRSAPGIAAKAATRSRLYWAMPPELPNASVTRASAFIASDAVLRPRHLIGPAPRPGAILRPQPRHLLPAADALVVLEPALDRRGKSGLGAGDDLVRHGGARRGREQTLAGGRRQASKIRRHRLQKACIDERHAHFQRMRHAGPIGVAQQLVAQIKAGFERRHFAPGGARLGLEDRGDVPDRVEPPQTFADEFSVHQVGQFPRHEHAAPQQVSTGVRAGILQKTRDLRVRQRQQIVDRGHRTAKRLAGERHARAPAHPTYPARNIVERRIAAGQFVAAEAGDRGFEILLARRLGHEPGVDAVDGRLVHGAEDFRQVGAEFLVRHGTDRVPGAVMASDDTGQRRLVVVPFAKFLVSERDGMDVVAAHIAH